MPSAQPSQPFVIAVFNQKGGISKTTTSTNLAVCLSAFGAKVVVIDLDAQGDSTKHLCETTRFDVGIYELFMGQRSLAEVLHPTRFDNIRIVPSTYDLAGIEIQLAAELSKNDDWQILLRNAVHAAAPSMDADYIVIDCPPGLGFLPVNALSASDAVLIPVTATPLAYDGLMRTLPIIDYIKGRFNKALQIHGILFTIVGRDFVGRKTIARLKQNFAADMYSSEIPLDDAVVEASGHRLPVSVFAPASRAGTGYLDVAAEFIERQDMVLRRRAGISGQAPRRPMADSRRQAFDHLLQLKELFGQVVRDDESLNANRRALQAKLSSGRSGLQGLHFWLVNAAIYYRGLFFFVLFLGAAFALLGLAASIAILMPYFIH